MKPNDGYLIIEIQKKENKTESGFVLSNEDRLTFNMGKVVEGNHKGEIVYFKPYAAIELNEQIAAIREDDVVAFEEKK